MISRLKKVNFLILKYPTDINIVIIIISNLFFIDLTITFTKQCKTNSRQPQV